MRLSVLCAPLYASALCCPRKGFEISPAAPGNGFEKPLGNVCAKMSDAFVSITAAFSPGAVTEDLNGEFLQRNGRYTTVQTEPN